MIDYKVLKTVWGPEVIIKISQNAVFSKYSTWHDLETHCKQAAIRHGLQVNINRRSDPVLITFKRR